ncbi:MAG: UDP-N-acetylglucosamine--N-acetylmuramyl-(pentapeptide) pyrophosphoryl-undecaprenol N-acetylglucosamine transferase [Candidatus Omnitrophica bacterium]|nr:UDP-N-acetylglucosamine--N-acetylmuramyl-(pentapeptide) pyrophosphoryl-undecaprenol N-acetylglucosamine transferase [Candidatus Omnitrophota bacterium]
MRVLVVASHSAGHIWPAIAFCQGLRDKNSDVNINFISTDGKIEKRLLNNNFNSIFFRRTKITILTSFNLIALFFRARALIKKLRPNLIVGFGGYLSIPFIICAHLQKIPNFIHEQNFDIGLANWFLTKFSDKIIFSFPNTHISDKLKNKAFFLGFPLRKELRRLDKKEARSHFGLDSDRFTLLVMGGSQGSSKINTQIINALKDKDFEEVQIIHIAGLFDYKRVEQEYKDINIKHRIFPFLDCMDYAFSSCDLAICRAGAGTIAEIVALRVPSILIPYPYAKQHQLDNAHFLSNKNAAILIEDGSSCEAILREKIIDLKNNSDRLRQISQALSTINISDARREMAELAFCLAR